jgi:hypothetical protein
MLISKPPSYVIFFLASAITIPNSRGQVPAADLERPQEQASYRRHDMTWHGINSGGSNAIRSHHIHYIHVGLHSLGCFRFRCPMLPTWLACLSCLPHSPVKKSCDRPSTDHKSKNTPPFFVYFVVHDSNCCLKTLPSPQFIFLPYTRWYPSEQAPECLLQIQAYLYERLQS